VPLTFTYEEATARRASVVSLSGLATGGAPTAHRRAADRWCGQDQFTRAADDDIRRAAYRDGGEFAPSDHALNGSWTLPECLGDDFDWSEVFHEPGADIGDERGSGHPWHR
jgi:hypothetical protein